MTRSCALRPSPLLLVLALIACNQEAQVNLPESDVQTPEEARSKV